MQIRVQEHAIPHIHDGVALSSLESMCSLFVFSYGGASKLMHPQRVRTAEQAVMRKGLKCTGCADHVACSSYFLAGGGQRISISKEPIGGSFRSHTFTKAQTDQWKRPWRRAKDMSLIPWPFWKLILEFSTITKAEEAFRRCFDVKRSPFVGQIRGSAARQKQQKDHSQATSAA